MDIIEIELTKKQKEKLLPLLEKSEKRFNENEDSMLVGQVYRQCIGGIKENTVYLKCAVLKGVDAINACQVGHDFMDEIDR